MIAFDNSLWKRRRSSVLILLIAFVVFVTAAVSLGLPSAAHAQGPPPTLIVPQPPAVFGDIYIDSNGNGVYDWPEERGIQGAALRLAGPSTPAADSASLEAYVTETDANGLFYFPELPGLGLYPLAWSRRCGDHS